MAAEACARVEWTVAFRTALAAAAVALALSSCTTPGDDPGPPLPVDPGAIYAQMCARCHGVDGRGDPELKKTLPVRNFADPEFQARAEASTEELQRTIMAGRGQMPAFGSILSAPKIQSLSGYVRRLGRSPARPAMPAAPTPTPAPAP